jgi:hypothetical protein
MRRKKVIGLAGLVGGSLYLRRRREAARERVHVYFDDGSSISLADDSPEAEQLLAPARQAV